MNPSTTRTCQTCGALVSEGAPCSACAFVGAFDTLGLNEPAAPKTHFSPIDLPSTFGHYRVEREIAAGGMGMVYEAEDTRLGRHVALKMLRQVFFATEKERLRFQSEAELASQLDHPNIVPIHEIGEHDGQPYFTMKFIRGGNLAERLAEEPIPARETAAMMIDIANAVHHAHRHGVLHLDLKPANILLDEQEVPLLTDFGLAKLLVSESSLTLTQTIAGTPDYMSPEQATGRKSEISTATDVWALGVILYQMLTGRLPFHGESPSEILRQVEERDPTSPSTIIHRIDRDLETLCLRCLEKDPARRLASAGELAEELKRWQRGEPVRARRSTRMERLSKWTRRHPFRTAAMTAFVIVLLSAAAAVMWQWRRATTNEQRALASAESERQAAEVARHTAYSATLSSSLAAREHHDFGQARRLLDSIDPELRGFDWRLLKGLCRGDEVQSFRLGEGTGSEPQCLALIPGKEQLALISADGRLHVRDLLGNELRPPRALPDGIGEQHRCYGLTFAPDRKRFAYARGDVLRVLDTDTFAILHEETSRHPQFDWLDNDRLLFGFNGSVAAPPYPEPGAWILNFHGAQKEGQEIPRISFPQMCAPLAVSRDRRFFVLHRVVTRPPWPRSLHVYRTDGDLTVIPKPIYDLPGREYPGDLTFSPVGTYLALSAGAPLYRNARVVEIASGRVLFDHEFRFPINGLVFDPQERRLGLVGDDSVVRVYDFTRGEPEGKNANTYDDAVELARCQQVDGRGAHVPPRDLVTRSAQDGRAQFFLGHESRVFSVLFDSAGSLITASGDGTIRRWPNRVPRPAVRLGYMETAYNLRHPAASADGRYVLFFADTTHLLDAARSATRNHNVIQFTGHRHSPIAVLRDGRPVTFGHKYGEIALWSNDAGHLKKQKRIPMNLGFDHASLIRNGVLSRDEKRLAGALRGRLFCVDFDTETTTWSGDLGKRLSTFANHDLSTDGKWIATSDFGPRITIHRFAEPDKIVTHLAGENRDYDTAVAFGRDGHRLYTGNEDGRIRVWDTATWQEIPELGWLAHRSAVTAIAVSNDRTLVATSGDDTLKLFPIDPEPGEPHRRERLSFHLDQPANWIQFASDENGQDRALLHSAPGRTLEIWETDRERDPPVPLPEDPSSLPFPLVRHAAVLLSSGKVLVVGGESNTSHIQNVALSDCHLYDPATRTWSTTGSLRSRRKGIQLTRLPSGEVLVSGGEGHGDTVLASCELYDPDHGTWQITGSMSTPRSGGTCILLNNGKVLAAGCSGADGRMLACELYDPDSGTWSPTAALPAAPTRSTRVVDLDNGMVLVVGLQAENGRQGSSLYSPTTGTWTPIALTPKLQGYPTATLLPSGQVLFVGGDAIIQGVGVAVPDCEVYDPTTGGWRSTQALPIPRSHHTATLLPDGKVLVIRGRIEKFGPPTADALLYDPATDAWSEAPKLLRPRISHTATLLSNGKVLLVGGSDRAGMTKSVELYEP